MATPMHLEPASAPPESPLPGWWEALLLRFDEESPGGQTIRLPAGPLTRCLEAPRPLGWQPFNPNPLSQRLPRPVEVGAIDRMWTQNVNFRAELWAGGTLDLDADPEFAGLVAAAWRLRDWGFTFDVSLDLYVLAFDGQIDTGVSRITVHDWKLSSVMILPKAVGGWPGAHLRLLGQAPR